MQIGGWAEIGGWAAVKNTLLEYPPAPASNRYAPSGG